VVIAALPANALDCAQMKKQTGWLNPVTTLVHRPRILLEKPNPAAKVTDRHK
jgi:hypothetical protein